MRHVGRLLICCTFALSLLAADPNQKRGFSPNDVFQVGELDNVNLFNGNVVIRLPIGQAYTVGPTLQYQFVLTYNSKIWDYKNEEWLCQEPIGCSLRYGIPENKSNAGFGWRLSLGRLHPPRYIDEGSSAPAHKWLYVGPDGAEHEFNQVLDPTTGGGDPVLARTTDASYLQLRRISPDQRVVEFPDGRTYTFNGNGDPTEIRLTEMRDLHGNWVKINYANALRWEVTDGHGPDTNVVRTHYVNIADKSSTFTDENFERVVSSIELEVFDNTPSTDANPRATYSFTYEDHWVGRGGGGEREGTHPSYCITAPFLSRITLPDNTTYDATYKQVAGALTSTPTACIPAPSDPYSHMDADSGVIQSLKLPTGGSIEWIHGTYPMNLQSCLNGTGFASSYVGVTERIFKGASGNELAKWTYTPVLVPQGGFDTQTCESDYGGSLGQIPSPAREFYNDVEFTSGVKKLRTRNYFSAYPQGGLVSGSGVEYGLPFKNTNATNLSFSDPLGSGGTVTRMLSSEISDCTESCSVQKSSYVRYAYETIWNNGYTAGNSRIIGERTVNVADTGCGGAACYTDTQRGDYDGFGHYRKSITTSNVPNTPARTTYTNHQPDETRWLLGKYSDSWTQQGSGSAATSTKTITTFDATLGIPTSVRRLRIVASDPTTIATSSSDLLTAWCRDSRGFVTSERYFGGDTGSIPSSNFCSEPWSAGNYFVNHTYTPDSSNPAKIMKHTASYSGPSGFVSPLVADEDLDWRTGLVWRDRDTAEVSTEYRFDSFGRITALRPTGRAWAEYQYLPSSDPPTVISRQCPNGSTGCTTTALLESRYYYDDLGRLTQERKKTGASTWAASWLTYDEAGRKSTSSIPVEVSSGVASTMPAGTAVTEWDYDVLGRLVTETRPDASKTELAYTGDRVKTRKSWIATGGAQDSEVTVTESYDGHGRLVAVKEKSASTSAANPIGSDVTTEYQYDPADRLAVVTSSAGGSEQERLFDYDGRGFLLSESHPEKDMSTYTYDARGNVLTRGISGDAQSEGNLKYTYDAAARLTQVQTYHSSSGNYRAGKVFEFGTANSGTNKKLGKLTSATRYNYSSGTVAVKESFDYDDPAGRLSKKTTEIRKDGVLLQTLEQSQTYDANGLIGTLTYPTCISVSCGAATWDTSAFGYTNGLLTSVQRFADAISYNPSGSVFKVDHAGPVTDTYTPDETGVRPKSITFEGYSNCTAPTITTGSPADRSIAPGQTATLTVSATNATSYQWYEGNGTQIAGQTSASYTTPALTAPKTYYVRVSSACATVTSRVATVTVLSLSAPTGLVATANGTSSATISWNASAGADHYIVERKSNGSAFVTARTVYSGTSVTDSGLVANRSYVYRVRAVSPDESVSSGPSNVDLATTMFLMPVVAGQPVLAAHFEELRIAVNAVRAANGASALSWSSILPSGMPAPAPGVYVYGQHILAVRSAMNSARTALGLAALSFTNPTLSGVPIRAVHVIEVRGGVE